MMQACGRLAPRERSREAAVCWRALQYERLPLQAAEQLGRRLRAEAESSWRYEHDSWAMQQHAGSHGAAGWQQAAQTHHRAAQAAAPTFVGRCSWLGWHSSMPSSASGSGWEGCTGQVSVRRWVMQDQVGPIWSCAGPCSAGTAAGCAHLAPGQHAHGGLRHGGLAGAQEFEVAHAAGRQLALTAEGLQGRGPCNSTLVAVHGAAWQGGKAAWMQDGCLSASSPTCEPCIEPVGWLKGKRATASRAVPPGAPAGLPPCCWCCCCALGWLLTLPVGWLMASCCSGLVAPLVSQGRAALKDWMGAWPSCLRRKGSAPLAECRAKGCKSRRTCCFAQPLSKAAGPGCVGLGHSLVQHVAAVHSSRLGWLTQ